MKQLKRLILIFAIAFAFFFISPAMFSGQFGPYDLMKNGDILDLVTPLVLIPLYWLLLWIGRDQGPSKTEGVVFMVLAALWVLGQGMHLAANSIEHLMSDMVGTDAQVLTYYYDEHLSHYMWHIGVMGLSALLIWRQWRNPFEGERSTLWIEGVSGLIYGLTFFLIIVEGQTANVGLPFAIIVAIAGLIWGRGKLRQQPILAFFWIGYLLATLFTIGWWIYWGDLIEFSDPIVGIIS
ncbi:MAG TPA: hypothetical protein VFI27_08575 [candidate division Zixibacteria bacterium]|nr:hypothetical protein [candidate division Zixibacteria bacterium]